MRAHQRHHLVDRYTRGDMSAAEQAEFRRLLETDPQLRSILDSDRLITSALQRDRAAIPANHARLEQQMMSVLHQAPAAMPAGAPAAATSAGALLSGKVITTIIAGIGIVAGSAWYLRSGGDAPAPPPVQQQVQPAVPGSGPQTPPAAIDQGAKGDRAMPGGGSLRTGDRAMPGDGSLRTGDRAMPGDRESAAGATAPAAVGKAGKSDPRSMNGSAVLSSDSVDVKLKLDRNKLGEPRDH